MNSRKALIIAFTIISTLFLSAAAEQTNLTLDYSSVEPSFNSVYSGNTTSSTINYTTGIEFDNCSVSTRKSSLPLGWKTSEPTFKEMNSTGYHEIKTPKITAVEYPENSTVKFDLSCQSPKKGSSAPLEITVDIENPSDLPYQYLRERAPYAVLILLLITVAGLTASVMRKRKSSEEKAEKMSQELIQDLKKRSYTPPEVKKKIKTAHQKIKEEDYEDAVSLLKEADQDLDRT